MTILTCIADDCDRPARARGVCKKHHYKLMKYGDPNAGGKHYNSPEESFAARTRDAGDCIVWTGMHTGSATHPYGVIAVDGAKQLAHRYAWERVNGPIPDGMMIDHACHNTLCVKAGHLRLATPSQNSQNVRGPRAGSTSGYIGVSRDRSGSWLAYVSIDKKLTRLGYFSNKAEAAAVAKAARLEHYTHNDHDRAA